MKLADVLGAQLLAAAMTGRLETNGGIKDKGKPARLRNKTGHGIARKAKNKSARKSRLRNR